MMKPPAHSRLFTLNKSLHGEHVQEGIPQPSQPAFRPGEQGEMGGHGLSLAPAVHLVGGPAD